VAIALVTGVTAWGLANRSTTELHVLRDRNPSHVRLHDGAIRNAYTLRIANRNLEPRRFEIGFSGVEPSTLKVAGARGGEIGPQTVSVIVPPDQTRSVRVFVTAPPQTFVSNEVKAAFVIRADKETTSAETVFVTGLKDTR
jgi:polyferredoxin